MSDTGELREAFEAARERFEQYRASISATFDERPAGELSRALDAILPDLVFYEGQACAASLGLERLDSGGGLTAVAPALARGLVEQQAARRNGDFLAGFAAMLARANQELPE